MKIDSTPKSERVVGKAAAEAGRVTPGPNRTDRAQGGARAVSETGGDKLTLSSTAAQLIEIANAADAADMAHQQRIESLKAQVANGQYRPEPAKVADGLLRDILVQKSAEKPE